jgi:hypothetical protein
VLLGPPADAALAPLAALPRQSGGRGQRRDHRQLEIDVLAAHGLPVSMHEL